LTETSVQTQLDKIHTPEEINNLNHLSDRQREKDIDELTVIWPQYIAIIRR
jgi:hypothetical protein